MHAEEPTDPPELSILMPAYNEQATLEQALDRALAASLGVSGTEIIVVDNGSTDRTREILELGKWPESVRVLRLERNIGKGGAVRHALGHARGRWSAILDADLEYDPNDLAGLLEPLQAGQARAAIGSRVFKAHSAYGFWYVVGGRTLSMAANMLYDAWLSDILSCLKVVDTARLRSMELKSAGFEIDAEIPARLLRAGERIYEVPITYRARSREEGKKLTSKDGARILTTLLRCRFDRWTPVELPPPADGRK